MKQAHPYRITIESLSTAAPQTLQFTASNHDDLFDIVGRMRQRGDFEPDEAAALALGLKLLGEVMLSHKNHLLFSSLKPHFGEFMKQLKGGSKDGGQVLLKK